MNFDALRHFVENDPLRGENPRFIKKVKNEAKMLFEVYQLALDEIAKLKSEKGKERSVEV